MNDHSHLAAGAFAGLLKMTAGMAEHARRIARRVFRFTGSGSVRVGGSADVRIERNE